MKVYVLIFIACLTTVINAIEKVVYQFCHEPIDVVIVAHEKDRRTLDLAIDGITKYIEHRTIQVVSEKQLTDKALWFDEAQFPFTKESIAFEIFQDEQKAQDFLNSPITRIGWIFQQLCKLYALFVIPDISQNVLVVDADTIFLRQVSFQTENSAPLFSVATEHHKPYFEHMARLIPGLHRVDQARSGVAHHMLFQKVIMQDLFEMIQSLHNIEPWKAICRCIDSEQLYGSCMSEYEIYFNFACMRTDQLVFRQLNWSNMAFRNFVCTAMNQDEYHYVSCHNYL